MEDIKPADTNAAVAPEVQTQNKGGRPPKATQKVETPEQPTEATKTVSATSDKELREKIPDVKTYGPTEDWILISKASSESEGWQHSTKAMNVKSLGCLVQVFYKDKSGAATSVTFVPSAQAVKLENGGKIEYPS